MKTSDKGNDLVLLGRFKFPTELSLKCFLSTTLLKLALRRLGAPQTKRSIKALLSHGENKERLKLGTS